MTARSIETPFSAPQSAVLPMRRGACPSIAAPMRTGDGLLVRLRPKTAGLSPDAVIVISRLAAACGNGLLEVTARGNLQVRGLRENTVPRFAAGLRDASIEVLTGVAIEIPALAGLDPTEVVDATPLADALRAAIAQAGPRLVLAPKLSIVVDGGGTLSLGGAVGDIRLDAAPGDDGPDNGEPDWRLSLAGDRRTAKPVALLPGAKVVASVMAVLETLSALGPAARGRDLDAARLREALDASEPLHGELEIRPESSPLGVHRIGDMAVLGLGLPYGQAQSARLEALASGLGALGASEFRLAPRRSLLVLGLSGESLSDALVLARREGFWTEGDEPGNAISVCAGSAGCASGTFDTRAAADLLTSLAPDLLDGSLDLHVSGCPKGCAHPALAGLSLTGSPEGVGLVAGGTAGDPPIARVAPADLPGAISRLGMLVKERKSPSQTARALIENTAPRALVSAYQGLS